MFECLIFRGVDYPERVAPKSVQLKSDYVHMSFEVKSRSSHRHVHAQQAFLRLFGVQDKKEVIIPFEFRTTGYFLVIENRPPNQMAPGTYVCEIIVGDASIAEPVLWQAVNVTFEGVALKSGEKGQLGSFYAKRPEITHEFRTAQKRPPAAISALFVGVLIVVFVAYLCALGFLKPSFSRFPFSLGGSVSALLFHGVVGFVMFLLLAFWYEMPFFRAGKWIAVAIVGGVLVWRRLLTHLGPVDEKAKKKLE